MGALRILVVGFTPTRTDPRILRHIAALRHEFDLVTMGTGPSPQGVVAHVELPVGVDHLPRTPVGLAALATRRHRLAYRQTPVVRAIAELAPDPRDFDLIIANDLITVPVMLELAGTTPVIADMHEYEPRQFEDLWQWRLALQSFYSFWCGESLSRAAAVVTVAPGIAQEYRREYGIECAVVMNAALYQDATPSPTGEVLRVVHHGQAVPSRRIHAMVQAAAGIPNLAFDLYLTPSGAGSGYLRQVQQQAARTSNVRVLPAVPLDQVVSTLNGYDLGLSVLYPSSFNIKHALPNKFFDFIQARLGLVVGPSPEMAAIVSRHGIGAVSPGFDVDALRATLLDLTPEQVDRWKQATHACAPALSAEQQAVTLREVVRSVIGNAGRAG